ncbi:MAG: hypothetical protein Q7R35_06820 [Elusimicrobiota bacterium]|nr:hypothetical protein [Elusimicrobiota bacterium]
MHSDPFPGFSPWMVPFFILGWTCFVLYLISFASGWRRLARLYPAYNPPDGTRLRFQSGKVGWAAYNNCLTYCAGFSGLYMAVFPLLSFGHRPLLIPWGEIRVVEEKSMFFRHYAVLAIGVPEAARITIPKKVLDASGQFLRQMRKP